MNLQEKRKKSANIAFALDMLHIVVGILIVIFAVLAFLTKSYQEYRDYAGVDEGMNGLSTRFAFKILSQIGRAHV